MWIILSYTCICLFPDETFDLTDNELKVDEIKEKEEEMVSQESEEVSDYPFSAMNSVQWILGGGEGGAPNSRDQIENRVLWTRIWETEEQSVAVPLRQNRRERLHGRPQQ